MDFALAQPRADRHPAGLLIVMALHVLVAAAMLAARLRSAPEIAAPPPLTRIDAPPSERMRPHVLPEPPKTLLHPLAVPVPEVVVDRAEPALQAAPAPVANAGAGVSGMPRVLAHGLHIDAGNKACRPRYPHVAEREGVTGITRLRIAIDATGHVTGATLLEASGRLRQNRNRDQAAIEALPECPVAAGNDEFGRPTGGTVDINYKWTIF